MKLSEAANRVIDLARKVREYYDTELPKWHPNYPLVGLDEETAPPPPEEKELKDFLTNLPDETIYQLLSIMCLGRGDFGTDDLAGYYESWKGSLAGPEHAAAQMMNKAPLADHLLDGLDELRKHQIDVDKFRFKKAKVKQR